MSISVVIPTLNVEDKIKICLESIKWADEIVVVDMGSTDKTIEICKKYNAKIYFNIPKDGNFDLNRKVGIQHATGDWILKLDSDEFLTIPLQQEIIELIKEKRIKDNGFYIYNRVFMFGREVKHGFVSRGSHELRLFKKDKWRYEPFKFHQQIYVDGEVGYLKNYYVHNNFDSISSFLKKTNLYTSHDAKYRFNSRERIGLFKLIFGPLRFFARYFFIKKGFLDGVHGLIVSMLFCFYNFIEKAKIVELQISNENKKR